MFDIASYPRTGIFCVYVHVHLLSEIIHFVAFAFGLNPSSLNPVLKTTYNRIERSKHYEHFLKIILRRKNPKP